MTNIRLGSHVPDTSRKFSTFAGLVICETTRPSPKMRPATRAARIVGIDQPATRWRTTKTVAAPDAMNTRVATMDRGESRAIPHTPVAAGAAAAEARRRPASPPVARMAADEVTCSGGRRRPPRHRRRARLPARRRMRAASRGRRSGARAARSPKPRSKSNSPTPTGRRRAARATSQTWLSSLAARSHGKPDDFFTLTEADRCAEGNQILATRLRQKIEQQGARSRCRRRGGRSAMSFARRRMDRRIPPTMSSSPFRRAFGRRAPERCSRSIRQSPRTTACQWERR